MSEKTLSLSTEDQVDTTVLRAQKGGQQGLSPESRYSNSSLSLSPDSLSSICNMSDREASTSPDISMLECCLSEGAPEIDPDNSTLSQGNVFCCTNTNLNQTFIATPVNGSMNFWNENLSLLTNQESGTKNCRTFNKNIAKKTASESNSTVMSPDSAGTDSQLSSCETSRRGSPENDCCSLSSGEMVLRSNSFCLEEQSLLVFSSLEESSISSATGHPASPAESHMLLTTLPDVCEKITDGMAENTGHPCLGMTFIQADKWELPTEDDLATSNPSVALPSENEDLLMTFVYETSPTGCGNEAQVACPETALFPHLSEALTPKQDTPVLSTVPAVQDTDKDIYTSTPVQNLGNKTPMPPSFSVSPCTEGAGSPQLRPVKKQQGSVTPTRMFAGLPTPGRNVSKMEINKFPKPDLSSIKSKIVTRTAPLGTALQHKPSQVNVHSKHTDAHRGRTIRTSPPKVRNNGIAVSVTPKMVNNTQRRRHTGAASLIKSSGHTLAAQCPTSAAVTGEGQGKSRASVSEHHTDASKLTSAVPCSGASSDTEQAVLSQVDASAQHAGNYTFCFSEKSPDRSGQMDPKPTPKKDVSNKIEVKSGSALGQDKPPVVKILPRHLSESSSSLSRPPKEKRTTLKSSTSFTISKAGNHPGQTKPGDQNGSSQCKQAIQAQDTKGTAENSNRKVKKIALVAETSKLTATVSSWDESKGRFRGRPSAVGTGGALFSKPPVASPRPSTLLTRQRQGILGRDDLKTSTTAGTPQSKQRNTGSRRGQATGESPLGTASTSSNKPQLNVSQPPQTPSRPSLMGPPPTPASRLSRKTLGPSRTLTEVGVHSGLSEGAGNAQVSGVAARRSTPFKAVVLKARLATTPGKNTGPTTTCKSVNFISKGLPNSTDSPLKRTPSSKLVHLTPSGNVDKNKPKAGSRQQQPDRHTSQPNRSTRPPDVVPASVAEGERKDERIQQLRGHLAASNYRFEAFTIVLQHALAERDEAIRQCRRLSQELVNLRGELDSSVNSSERLEKEKEELRAALDDALQKLQEQHQKDLTELEQRLQAFYQAEWDKVHQTYQEEADKCKSLLQQQMGELKANHESMTLELENSHAEQLQCVKQQYEHSLEELRKVHTEELESLDKTLKDAEAALSGKIEELTVENNALIEKLTAEDNKRKELAEKSQKDSHTVYLEQELESLKVVLDIKNKQLHQQEKKMMEIDKLTEKNVKLDESLRKVQQENEDLKARMERHAALSRQLSTEQAMLQESLHKESKVNKRLSMENEELLWKLHNGDLSSPRKVSPTSTSPSHSFNLQSPRSSAFFSSSPVSPR